MCRSAPRIAWPLIEAIPKFDEPGLAIADLWRRLCAHAATLDLPKPSYEQTRVLVHRSRSIRAMPGVGEMALDIVFRTRAPSEAAAIAADRLNEKAAARHGIERERTWRPAG